MEPINPLNDSLNNDEGNLLNLINNDKIKTNKKNKKSKNKEIIEDSLITNNIINDVEIMIENESIKVDDIELPFTLENVTNTLYEFNEDDKKKKRKRRTKDEISGKAHLCEFCKKTYFSYPALNFHIKNKHNSEDKYEDKLLESEKKSRGRPRKHFQLSSFFTEIENRKINFFEKYNRKKNNENIMEDLKESLIKIILELKNEIINSLIEINLDFNLNCDDHPFFKLLNKDENTYSEFENKNNKITIDEAIINFIKNIQEKTNPEYLNKIIKYTLLLREVINTTTGNKLFTNENLSEMIPEYSNHFLKFINKNNFCNFNDNDKLDLVEFINYFVYWLNTNELSSLKINILLK